jgi:glucose-6-phosphate isomerase
MTSLNPGDYLVVLAYLPDDDPLLSPVRAVIPALAEKTGAATCFELGPRYLHSTGQLHKGGRNTGVFVLVTTRDERDVAVPSRAWTLRDLHRAQAEGDFATLAKHGRRALHLDLPDASAQSLELLAGMLQG